jgi:hypothetical protein
VPVAQIVSAVAVIVGWVGVNLGVTSKISNVSGAVLVPLPTAAI